MNQRIKELMRHAGTDTSGKWMGVEHAEKFAELIIKECAELCKKQEYYYWRSTEDQDYTPIDCANAIEEHFGLD